MSCNVILAQKWTFDSMLAKKTLNFILFFPLFNFFFLFLLFQDPQEQLSEESSAFDKNETNAFRENSKVVEAIRPYLTNKSSSPSAGFGGELRPAFNLAFADLLTSK